MKRKMTLLVCLGLLACSCSSSVHMPKHRKSRHCNCPTFGMAENPGNAQWSMHNAQLTLPNQGAI